MNIYELKEYCNKKTKTSCKNCIFSNSSICIELLKYANEILQKRKKENV